MPLQDDGSALERIAAAFDSPLLPTYAYLGARFIDSTLGGPVALTVSPQGPAAAAGLTAGDRILAVAGQPVGSVGELLSRVSDTGGGDVAFTAGTEAEPRELRLTIRRNPGVIDLATSDILDPVMAARLSNELLKEQPAAPGWMLQLNQAALYLRATSYQDAVPLLRAIQAPATAGLGRAMVDYWLGSTLLSIDARLYGDAARQALERAVESEGARLYHADGPLLAPRARARLAEVERLTGN